MLDQELHCSCWSLNIGGFSNNLTINQFYLSVSLPKTLSFTHILPSHLTHYCSGDLGTLSLGIPYHTCNVTKVARETTVFCFFFGTSQLFSLPFTPFYILFQLIFLLTFSAQTTLTQAYFIYYLPRCTPLTYFNYILPH